MARGDGLFRKIGRGIPRVPIVHSGETDRSHPCGARLGNDPDIRCTRVEGHQGGHEHATPS